MTRAGRPSRPIVGEVDLGLDLDRAEVAPLRGSEVRLQQLRAPRRPRRTRSVAGRVVVELPQRVVERAARCRRLPERCSTHAWKSVPSRVCRNGRSGSGRAMRGDGAGVVGDELLVARRGDARRRGGCGRPVRGPSRSASSSATSRIGLRRAVRRARPRRRRPRARTAARRAPSGSIGHCSTRRSPRYGSSPGSSSGSLDAERVGDLDEEHAALARLASCPTSSTRSAAGGRARA